jgi:hypothetical protein
MSEYLFDILARVIYRKLESPFTVKLGFCKPVRKFRIFQGARSFFMSISFYLGVSLVWQTDRVDKPESYSTCWKSDT